MRHTLLTPWRALWTALLGAGLLTAFIGCAEWNDNPAQRSMVLQVPLAPLQSQLGYAAGGRAGGFGTLFTAPGDTDATSEVKALVIGAMVSSRSTPLTDDTPLNDATRQQIEDDLLNSLDYFVIVALPSSLTAVDVPVPPASAGNWQVVGLGTRTQPNVIGDLNTEEHADAIIYYGFEGQFRTTGQLDDDTVVSVNMRRACLVETPPKGCAQYLESATPAAVVTAAVEILGVYLDGAADPSALPEGYSYPLRVRDDATAGACGGATACNPGSIELALSAISGVSTAESVTVRTTHALSAGQSAACQAATTVAALEANCLSVESYTTQISPSG